jgi:1-acyl-sn-glycerol-3-phosphate acyltransferase
MPEDVALKPQVYKDPRPAEVFEEYHERVRDHPPEPVYEVVRVLTMMNALITYRARGYGSENVPNGPVILAPNHASFMDHFFCGAFIRRHVQFMAKSQMFKRTPLTWIYSHGGVFPVRRGHHDEDAFTTAFAVLERGGLVCMYVEGGRTRTGELSDEAKPGIGRLALESGAAVVPVAILGSHQVRNWKKLHFPKVIVEYGTPFRFERIAESSRGQQQAVANEILRRITAMHTELERLGPKGVARRERERGAAGAAAPPGRAQEATTPPADAQEPVAPPTR